MANEKDTKKAVSAPKKAPARPDPSRSDKPRAKKSKKKSQSTGLKSALPYITVILGLIIGVCIITVHLFGLTDGVGILGAAIQALLSGLFGIGAVFIPFVFFYIGIKWILFNIKWKFSDQTDKIYLRERGTLRLQTAMALTLILLLSVTFGVGSAYYLPGFMEMWADGADMLSGGGVIGTFFAYLMVLAFEQLITYIILTFLAVLALILMAGLTPDRVVFEIKKARDEKRLVRAAEKAERKEEEKRALAELKHQQRLAKYADAGTQSAKTPVAAATPAASATAAAATAAVREKPRASKLSVDEFLGLDPSDTTAQTPESAPEKEIYIGPVREEPAVTAKPGPASAAASPSAPQGPKEGEDYGADAVFEGNGYKTLEGVMENAKTGKIDFTSENAGDIPEGDIALGVISEDELHSDIALVTPDNKGIAEELPAEVPYVFPPITLLSENKNSTSTDYSQELQENARKLMETLSSFKVGIREITYSRGPTITRYELKPDVGIRVKTIANLVDDIALSLATSGVRIEAPIPNKPAVGIEVPNRTPATVYLRDLIESSRFTDAKSNLTSCLGMDVGGNAVYFDISKMPHLLIAGATGMGKSVCINSIIISLLYKARPDQLKLILIDPKKVEFNIYKEIPHLYAPIVSDPKKAAGALASAVAEMERRFTLIEEVGVRDIGTYNKATEEDSYKEHLPHMVIIIDELADLMMTAAEEVETSICRLAQKARAAGIHLVIGTQRPSVDVITGLIKSNIPSRIACTVASQIDSRTIIDMAGAEKLIGRGDMLFAPVGAAKPLRVQGSFVSESEVEKIVAFIKETNSTAKYNNDFIQKIEEEAAKCGLGKKDLAKLELEGRGAADEGGDEKFRDAVLLAIEENKVATSLLQRRLGIGYGRAAKIIDTMEQMGYVSKPDGNKPRKVLISMEEYMRRIVEGNLGEE